MDGKERRGGERGGGGVVLWLLDISTLSEQMTFSLSRMSRLFSTASIGTAMARSTLKNFWWD